MRLSDHVCFHHSPLMPKFREAGLMNPNSVNEPQEMARGDHSCRLRGMARGSIAVLQVFARDPQVPDCRNSR